MSIKDQKGLTTPVVAGIVVAVLAVLVIGAYAYQSITKDDGAMMEKESEEMMEKEDDSIMEKTDEERAMMEQDDAMIEDKTDDAMMQKDDSVMEDKGAMMDNKVQGYVTYSPAVFEAAKDQKRVLFFHASWCPTCKVVDTELTAKSNALPSGVVVLKTDYDSERALKSKYGVTYQHTFVQVDANGNQITKWNGGGVNEIVNNVK